jgi:hypothetical protein
LEAKEKLLQQAEKKKLKKARKLLSQKKKKGRKKIDEEMEAENFNLGRSLEQYDQLVHQLYHCENGRIYEIINVFNDKKTGKFTSTARAVIPQGEVDDIPR